MAEYRAAITSSKPQQVLEAFFRDGILSEQDLNGKKAYTIRPATLVINADHVAELEDILEEAESAGADYLQIEFRPKEREALTVPNVKLEESKMDTIRESGGWDELDDTEKLEILYDKLYNDLYGEDHTIEEFKAIQNSHPEYVALEKACLNAVECLKDGASSDILYECHNEISDKMHRIFIKNGRDFTNSQMLNYARQMNDIIFDIADRG